MRESGRGGMSHACELETSVYLYLDADRVQMEKARKEMDQPSSDFIWSDHRTLKDDSATVPYRADLRHVDQKRDAPEPA